MRNRALSLSLAALLVACSHYSDDCRKTLTCETPYPVKPYCDGYWHYIMPNGDFCTDPDYCTKDGVCCTEDGICPYCPVLDEDGEWSYPDDPSRTPWDPADTVISKHPHLECIDSSTATGGSGGGSGSAGAAGSTEGSGDAGAPPDETGAGAAAGGEDIGVSGAGGAPSAGAAGASGSAGTAGVSATAGASGTAGSAGSAGTAGSDGAAGAGGAHDDCVTRPLTGGPDEDACAIDDRYGVFVASYGSDDADGYEAEPVATIAAALDRAADRGLAAIYVCAEQNEEALPYTEAVTLSGVDSLKIYGGFNCSTPEAWTYDSETALKAQFTLEAGLSFRIDDATGLELVDIAVNAASATDSGGNSIAMWITNSTDLSLKGVALSAGEGADGATAKPEDFEYQFPDDLTPLNGYAATEVPLEPGGAKSCVCEHGPDSAGGAGGARGGQSGAPDPSTGATSGVGSQPGDCSGGPLQSQHGAVGADASPASSAAVLGATSSEGDWVAQAGEDGEDGGTGQGGGGGASTSASNAGGGGGCGGCGGAGALGGEGGGSSIALLVMDSTVSISRSKLTTGNGGAGGSGVPGQTGQTRSGEPEYASLGGDGIGIACDGGQGGRGGNGGASGGGAGGISVGILWQGGEEPVQGDDTIIQVGSPGLGGLGSSIDPDAENRGIDGIKQETLDAANPPTE